MTNRKRGCYHFFVNPAAFTAADRMKEEPIMAFKITDACIMCGACAENCPKKAIKEGATKYEIDPKLCTECGECADICPVGAPEKA